MLKFRWIACALLAATSSQAASIVAADSFDVKFVDAATIPLSVNAFNPALGTLNSVQVFYSLTILTSTLVTNTTLLITPGGHVPTPLPGTANGIAVIMLNANGLPISTQSPSSGQQPFTIPPGTAAAATTFLTANGNPSVPAPEIAAFSKLGLAPLQFSAQEFVTVVPTPIGTAGAVIVGATTTEIIGTVIATYDYTPFVAAPEPAYAGIFALTLLAFIRLRSTSKSANRSM